MIYLIQKTYLNILKEIIFNSNYFSPLDNYNEDDIIEIITKLYEKEKIFNIFIYPT
jgi:hypothetical protein